MTEPLIKGTRTKRGVLTKVQRAALADTLSADVFKAYRANGGVRWLIAWAKDNPTEFMKLGLARLLPPMPKEDPDIQINQQFNSLESNPTDVARRLAFVLAAGVAAQDDAQAKVIAEREPYVHTAQDMTPQQMLTEAMPSDPTLEPLHAEWARTAAMSPEERLNSESLDEHCSRKASPANRPAWMDSPQRAPGHKPVRLHNRKNRDDLL